MKYLSGLALLAACLLVGCADPGTATNNNSNPPNVDKPETSNVSFEFVKDDELNSLVSANGVVVANFTADWWPSCQPLKPKLKSMAGEFAGKATFVKVDLTDRSNIPESARTYSISSIPATLIIKDGEVAATVVGANEAEIRTELEKAL